MFAASAIACDDCCGHEEIRKIYLGIEGGISGAMKKEFTHKSTKMTGSLKASPLYGALIGYRFYPGMAIEASWQHKPRYKMNFKLPKFSLGPVEFSKTPGSTKIISDIYLIGLTYDFPEVNKVVPYVGLDAGIARITSKSTSVYKDFTAVGGGVNTEFFRIMNKSNISPAVQLTLGISSGKMFDNVKLNLSGRVQVISNAKVNYQKFDAATQVWGSKQTLKQTLGVAEVVLGITYDLPI